MNRRGFLRLLAGTAAASTTKYFLPPIGGWRSDIIVNPADVCIGQYADYIDVQWDIGNDFIETRAPEFISPVLLSCLSLADEYRAKGYVVHESPSCADPASVVAAVAYPPRGRR